MFGYVKFNILKKIRFNMYIYIYKVNISKQLSIFFHVSIRHCFITSISSIFFFPALWKEKLELSRDWFLERESMKSDETRRPGKVVDSGDIFGFEGSFRKLNVD